jgi:ABC-type branched-subunit amino acid transport system substrate-binding protein
MGGLCPDRAARLGAPDPCGILTFADRPTPRPTETRLRIPKPLVLLTLPLLALLPAAGVGAAPRAKPIVLAFLAPANGPGADAAAEILEGARAAARDHGETKRTRGQPIEIVSLDATLPARELKTRLARTKAIAAVAAAPGGLTAALARFVRARKLPCVLATPFEPPFTVKPGDPLFHLGGDHVDHAVVAAGFCRIPLSAVRVAALHDASVPSRDLAAAFLRNLAPSTLAAGAHSVPASREHVVARLRELAGEGVDVVFVASGRVEALRVAKAAREGGVPKLLFADGLLSPEITMAAPEGSRFLVGTCPTLDRGPAARYRITRREKNLEPAPLGERGHAAVSLLVEALGAAGHRIRGLVPALRGLGDERRLGTPVFTPWGQAGAFDWFLWEIGAEGPAATKPTYLPSKTGGLLLRHRPAAAYRPVPGDRVALLTWGDEDEATIDEDLRRTGLLHRGYEARLDEMVKDEILARMLARLNRLFWRRSDGTPIPGVSFGITFAVAPDHPRERKGCWIVKIAGDDPRAGGRAADPYALVFSSFLVRTIYAPRALEPALGAGDARFFTGGYAWGSDVDSNIRHDEIRCLIEGFAGGLSLTAAHELGHLAGLGHDTSSPRSIMNVAEGAGLEPDWAEWVVAHVRTLEARLGRAGTGRRR